MLFNNIFHQSKYFVALTSIVTIMSSPLYAASQATGALSVSATVIDTCTVTATPMAFASLNTSVITNNATPSQITIICTSEKTGVNVTLDGGTAWSGSERQMTNQANNKLPYSLYKDAARETELSSGDTISTNMAITAVEPTFINIFGQVTAGDYAVGIYSDTVTITVNY